MILGAAGQLGRALLECVPAGWAGEGFSSAQLDITDASDVRARITGRAPDVVINCAAYTRVDDAETDRDRAFAVNGLAAGNLARVCREAGVRFVHVSTDYVFGDGAMPRLPGDVVAPLNVYGESKLDGERRVGEQDSGAVIVRTAWVHSGAAGNFVATAVRVLRAGTTMRVVDDQIGTPTRARHLADALWRFAQRPALQGTMHFTDAGVASWYDVARVVRDELIAREACDPATEVVPTGSAAFPRPARRPSIAVLDKRTSWEAIDYQPIDWRQGIQSSVRELLDA